MLATMGQPAEKATEKNLKVPVDLHKEIAHESIERSVPMYMLIAEAWEAYKKQRREPVVRNLRTSKHGTTHSSIPENLIPAVEAFVAWLETRPDTPDRAEVRAFMLKRMNCPDPMAEPAKRKNAG